MGAHIDEMAQNIETEYRQLNESILSSSRHARKHSPIMMAITMIPMTPMMIIIYEERRKKKGYLIGDEGNSRVLETAD